jgi:CheY-like chemotaxis protein
MTDLLRSNPTFNIFLPASLKKSVDIAPSSGIVHKGSGTIIIMDDEDYMRDIAEQMLLEMGYKVIKTSDGVEAIDIFLSSIKNNIGIKAILLDLTNSGGMGGRDAIQELRRLDKSIPIFATSGYSEDPVMSKPGEYGFTDSICKPYMKSELADLLSRNLR